MENKIKLEIKDEKYVFRIDKDEYSFWGRGWTTKEIELLQSMVNDAYKFGYSTCLKDQNITLGLTGSIEIPNKN